MKLTKYNLSHFLKSFLLYKQREKNVNWYEMKNNQNMKSTTISFIVRIPILFVQMQKGERQPICLYISKQSIKEWKDIW